MAKRDTVNVNCDNVLALIRANEWSNAAFSRKVGKYSSWFGEVLRGNNLPSPQEAAQMCVLLQTTPDEILLHQGETEEQTAKCQKDIALKSVSAMSLRKRTGRNRPRTGLPNSWITPSGSCFRSR